MWGALFIGFLLGVAFSVATAFGVIYKFLLRGADQPPIRNYYTEAHADAEGYGSASRAKGKAKKGNAGIVGIPDEDEESEETSDTVTHKESSDWLNIATQRLFDEITTLPNITNFVISTLNRELNSMEGKPDILGTIHVEDLDFGSSLPRFSHIVTKKRESEVQFDFSVSYSGGAVFNASTELWLNWPTKALASLPVGFSVTLVALKARVRVKCCSGVDPMWSVGLLAEPLMELDLSTVLGYERKLKDVAKLTDFIIAQIRGIIARELVLPNGFAFHIPVMDRPLRLTRLSDLAREMKLAVEHNEWRNKVGEKEKGKEMNAQLKGSGPSHGAGRRPHSSKQPEQTPDWHRHPVHTPESESHSAKVVQRKKHGEREREKVLLAAEASFKGKSSPSELGLGARAWK